MRALIASVCCCPFVALAGAPNPDLQLELVAGGFSQPVAVRAAGDGSNRLFVVEQDGLIRILRGDGSIDGTPFLDLSVETGSGLTNSSGERGLLGLAFHPDYASNGLFYVNYTDLPGGNTVIARYQVSGDADVADAGSRQVVMTIAQDFGNHNGGDIHFGPDGYLYIGMGDGGSGGDPNSRAQDPGELLGKLLRIDVDNPGANPAGACGDVANYGIPADNPFTGDAGTCSEITAFGLRNPFRFSFDAMTGDLFIGDVGQNRVEEIDFLAAADLTSGANFGWDCREGDTDYPMSGDPGDDSPLCDALELGGTLIDPIIAYDSFPSRCSVSGGYRYRGPVGAFQGLYFFGDFCTGEVFAASEDGGAWPFAVVADLSNVSAFGEGAAGELYVVDYGAGEILLITEPVIFRSSFEAGEGP